MPRAAALQALATLREFAVSGDVGAVGALGLTLARPLQPVDTPEEAYLEAASFDAFIADERLPPLIRVYASLHSARSLLANLARLHELALAVSATDEIAPFQRLVAADSLLADEALRAYVLCAFIHYVSVQGKFSPDLGPSSSATCCS